MSNNNPQDDTDSHTPPPSQPTDNERARRSFRNLLWVIIVLLIGAIVGIISFLLIAHHLVLRGGPLTFFGAPMKIGELFTFIAEHIILSTVSIALLVSLVIVYARIYRQTKANFALGIFIVLMALLFEAILNYPILLLMTTPGGVPISEFSYSLPTLADVFTIVAYSIFLYLSLQ